MASMHRRKNRNIKMIQLCLAVCAVALVLIVGVVCAQFMETRLSVKVENAGQQMTEHNTARNAAE